MYKIHKNVNKKHKDREIHLPKYSVELYVGVCVCVISGARQKSGDCADSL